MGLIERQAWGEMTDAQRWAEREVLIHARESWRKRALAAEESRTDAREQLRGAVATLEAIRDGAPGTDHTFYPDDDAIVPMNLARRYLDTIGGQ